MQGRYRFKDEDGDEVKVKDESDIDNRKVLEEREAIIKDLKDKMNNNVKIKQMTTEYENSLIDNASTDKDKQIAELVNKVNSLEKELKEQIEKSDEKLEEELQKCKETMVREMEEKLQQVQLREAANQNNNNEAMVLRLLDRFTTMEQNIQCMRDETADLKIGMNQQAEAIREEIRDTKRQVSDEVSEKMTKQMKEQEVAIRDEVQNTKQELKDEMAAKMDEQTQKINELQTDIQEAINPPPEPKEEIKYTPCKEAETPHDGKPSQCAKSSSSANCGIDSIPAQDSRGTGTDEFV